MAKAKVGGRYKNPNNDKQVFLVTEVDEEGGSLGVIESDDADNGTPFSAGPDALGAEVTK